MRNLSYYLCLTILIVILLGCSSSADNPTIPDSDPQLTQGADRLPQQSDTHMLGYFDVIFDVENNSFELVPNRSVDFSLNLMKILANIPTSLGLGFNGATPGPGYVDIDVDITINHPVDDAMFDIYDVRAIFMGDGSWTLDYDSDLVYADPVIDITLLNADGHTRWFNPSEFIGDTLFHYAPNFLSTPDYTCSATLNPYKYYGSGLSSGDNVWDYLISGGPEVGYFTHGMGFTRNFLIRFPIQPEGIKYGFAIIANWGGTEPANHPSHANEAVGVSLEDYSTLYWVDELDSGGNLILDISVFDWDAELAGNVMLDYDIYLDSTVLLTDYKLNTTEMSSTASGPYWNSFHVEIPAEIITSTVGNELWIIVEDSYADYTNPLNVQNNADDDPIAACFRFPLDVASEPVPWILVTSPNGGETWDVGESYEITWEASPYIDNVAIGLSLDSGGVYTMLLTPSAPNTGSFEWNPIPLEAASENCRIKVMDVEDFEVWDQSDADFTITAPWIEVTSPNGGESWSAWSTQLITWNTSETSGLVTIEYSKDGFVSDINEIVLDTENDGSFLWENIPYDLTSTARIRVSSTDPVISDISDADFSIVDPEHYIQVTSPNGGESWKVISDHEITWDSSESTGEVYIEYSKDDFVSDINPIVNNTPNDGSYMWVDIPNDLSDTVKVRVYSVDPFMSDTSDAVFSIIEPDEYITVLSPNGGEEWELKTDHEITWESSGVTGNVNIYCSRDNFVSDIYTIIEDEPNTLSYVWVDISAAPSDTLRVKVEWDDYPIISDISDADFSITDIGWGRAWGGQTYDTDEGNAVAVDNSGNVHVTGTFYGSFDFDPDPFGGHNLTSNGYADAFLSKFDSMGNLVWARSWGGTTDDQGLDVAVDSYGNVYVTGDFHGTVDFDPNPIGEYTLTSNGTDDAYLIKLDSSGNFVWARAWGGSSYDYGYGVAIDSTGDVYVTGGFGGTVDFDPDPIDEYPQTSNGSDDAYLIKLDSSGNFVWARTWGGTLSDYGYEVAVDGAGNAYVTGNFQGTVDFDPDPVDEFSETSNGLKDIFLSKFDSSGNFLWAGTWGGTSSDYGNSVAVDGTGNAYVTGSFQNTVDFDPDPVDEFPLTSNGNDDVFLSKLDSSGNFVWAGAWGGSTYDYGNGVAIDSEGNTFVTGQFRNTVDFDPDPVDEFPVTSNGYNDAFLSKFDSSGNFEWVRTVGESLWESAKGVAVDGSGNLFITGYFESATIDLAPEESPCFEDPDLHNLVFYSDIFLVKYMPDGCW